MGQALRKYDWLEEFLDDGIGWVEAKLVLITGVQTLNPQQSFSASSASSDWGFGISFASTPSSISVGIGVNSNEQGSGQSGESNAQSVISAGRDVNISAGEDATLTAAQVSAARDVSIVAEDNVTLNAATDTNTSAYNQSHTFAGLTLEVSSGLVSAFNDAKTAYETGEKAASLEEAGDAIVAGVAAAGALYGILKKGANIVSASLTIGVSTSSSGGTNESSSSVVTSIAAGSAIEVVAISGDLTAEGTQIVAGLLNAAEGDIDLYAGEDILLASAANDNVSANSNSTFSAGIGVSVGLGLEKVAKGSPLGLALNLNISNGSGSNDGMAQTNAHVTGTGQVNISSGDDTTLAGAVVKGKGIDADVGGDLSVTSVTDNAAVDVNQMGIGLSLSGSVQGGTPSLSGGPGISGNYAQGSGQSVTLNEQSGLFAGSDGLQVKVEDKTTLIGGALASTADPSKNSVTSGTIETKDVAVGSSYDVTSLSGGIGTDGKLAIPGHENDNGSSSGVVKSTIAAGELSVTDEANQAQDLASLNREAPTALPTIDKLPDLNKILQEQSTSIAMYQKAASSVAGMIGDLAAYQGKDAEARLKAAQTSGDAAAIALAQADIAGWTEGGAYRTALHGLAGAILGSADGLTGIIGGGAGGVTSSLIIPIIAKAVDDQLLAQGLDPKDPKNAYLKNLLNSTFTTAFAGALTGGTGAAYATANVDFNYLTHEQLEKAAENRRKWIECIEKEGGCSEKDTFEFIRIDSYYVSLSLQQTAKLVETCTAAPTSAQCKTALKDLNAFNAEVQEKYNVFGDSISAGFGASGPGSNSVFDYDATVAAAFNGVGVTKTPEQANEDLVRLLVAQGGLVTFVGGAVQVAGVFVCSGTVVCGVAVFAALAGANRAIQGGMEIYNGEKTNTLIEKALIAAGTSDEAAANILFALEAGTAVAELGAGGILVIRHLNVNTVPVVLRLNTSQTAELGAASATTATVWDKIISTTDNIIPGTQIPATFTIKAGDLKFWVNSNGTKHFGEYLSGYGPMDGPITSQAMLSSFEAAVSTIAGSGTPNLNQVYNVGGWEIIFSQNSTDLYPVIKHALYQGM